MVLFSRLAFAAASIAGVVAAPWDPTSKYSTHRTRIITRDLSTGIYHPENVYKTYNAGVVTPLKKRGDDGTVEENASSFIMQELNIGENDFQIRSSATTDTGGHVWVQQVVVSRSFCLMI